MQTKEEKQEYFKKYYQDNKEKFATYYKEYRRNNPEKSKADGYYTVYYLKEEHYAGMTNSLKARLAYHKSHYNRHIEDVEVFGSEFGKGTNNQTRSNKSRGSITRDGLLRKASWKRGE